MDGFEKRRNDKKDSIMQAAMELFVEYGFERVTVTEIAEKAHVSKVSIYNFFESKDNLRRVIIKGILDKSLEQTTEFVESDDCFNDKIKKYLAGRIIYGNQQMYRFFFEAVESDTMLKKYLNDFSVASKQLVFKMIQSGKDAGQLAPNISNKAIEVYIDIFQNYVLHLSKESISELEHSSKLVEEINYLFLHGMLLR